MLVAKDPLQGVESGEQDEHGDGDPKVGLQTVGVPCQALVEGPRVLHVHFDKGILRPLSLNVVGCRILPVNGHLVPDGVVRSKEVPEPHPFH